MDREQAKRLIGGVFDEASDDVETERLATLRSEVDAQIRSASPKVFYLKLIDALDTELNARAQGAEAASSFHIEPQTPAQTLPAGGPEDVPGDLRHGVRRDASHAWRVTGR